MLALLVSLSLQSADPYIPPPALDDPDGCVCAARSDSGDVSFSGHVVDAKVILGADRRSVEERMATIFDVETSSDADVGGRTPVWHNVSENECGVTFDYGKKYSVSARRNDAGELETDKCLMGW